MADDRHPVRILHFDSIDSTSDEAKRRARAGERGPVWIVSEHQTRGRGRYGRSWLSEPGNLYTSLLLHPDCTANEVSQLSFVAAVSVHQTLAGFTAVGDRFSCKWPNDILLDDKKICGVLLESNVTSGALDWAVIGIGINVTCHPERIDRPATALAKAGLATPSPTDLLDRLSRKFEEYYGQWRTLGFGPIRQAWLASAAYLGQRITTQLASEVVSGIFEDLDEDGALILRTPQGGHRRVHAGEIYAEH